MLSAEREAISRLRSIKIEKLMRQGKRIFPYPSTSENRYFQDLLDNIIKIPFLRPLRHPHPSDVTSFNLTSVWITDSAAMVLYSIAWPGGEVYDFVTVLNRYNDCNFDFIESFLYEPTAHHETRPH